MNVKTTIMWTVLEQSQRVQKNVNVGVKVLTNIPYTYQN